MSLKRGRKRIKIKPVRFTLSMLFFAGIIALAVWGTVSLVKSLVGSKSEQANDNETADTAASVYEAPKYSEKFIKTSDTYKFGAEIECENGILIDRKTGKIICERDGSERIYPASMTKIMTLIVAVENIKDTEDTYKMTIEILDDAYLSGASVAGFARDEECRLLDLLYGAILPSGADATTALANYVSGGEQEFVKLMNEKAAELGLTDTHFENASGLHSENHYSTCKDIAVMLDYALENKLCREILSTYQYTAKATPQHPEGLFLESTMLSRMYGDEAEGMLILGGKTGYTAEARHSLASFAVRNSDKNEYILVLANGADKWKPVFDSFNIYMYMTSGKPLTAEQVSQAASSQN